MFSKVAIALVTMVMIFDSNEPFVVQTSANVVKLLEHFLLQGGHLVAFESKEKES